MITELVEKLNEVDVEFEPCLYGTCHEDGCVLPWTRWSDEDGFFDTEFTCPVHSVLQAFRDGVEVSPSFLQRFAKAYFDYCRRLRETQEPLELVPFDVFSHGLTMVAIGVIEQLTGDLNMMADVFSMMTTVRSKGWREEDKE
jgi:hypothetical protein